MTGYENLRQIMKRLHNVYFQELFPIAQYTSLRQPATRISRIAAVRDHERVTVLSHLASVKQDLQSWLLNDNQKLSLENTLAREALLAVQGLLDDDHLRFYPSLSENFMSGIYTGSWQYAVLEEKLLIALGGKTSPVARETLLHVYELTVDWLQGQLEVWRQAAASGWVMSQGAVLQTIHDLHEKYTDDAILDVNDLEALKNSVYFKLAFTETSLDEQTRACQIISPMLKAWRQWTEYLEKEYLPVAIRIRPFARPGLNALGIQGDALYRHLIRRAVTEESDPIETASLGRQLTANIQQEMTFIGKEHFQCNNYNDVSELLKNHDSPHSFLQQQTAESVLAYLANETKDIEQVLPREFSVLPRCKHVVKLFRSSGVAYYVQGRVNFEANTPSEFCVEHGTYYAGVPTLTPGSRFSYERDDLSLLMHEAIPGHHLQLQLALEAEGIYQLMGEGLQSCLTGGQSGFSEGWALYAESLGFRLGLYEKPMRALRHHNNNLLRTLRLTLDSELNTGRCDRQTAVQWMVQNGFSEEYAQFEVDRYTALPGQALGYMLGCLVLQNLRKEAEEKLESRFHAGSFHNVVLRTGTVTLETVRHNVHAWIEETLAK